MDLRVAGVLGVDVAHEEERGTVVRRGSFGRGGPFGELVVRIGEVDIGEAGVGEAVEIFCELGAAFIKPSGAARLLVLVNHMLEFVGQHIQIIRGREVQQLAIHKEHRALITEAVDLAGHRVLGRVIA